VYWIGVVIVEGEGAVLTVGHRIVTNGILCVRGGDADVPKFLWDLLSDMALEL